jgi:CHAT domain-containing protein
LVAANLNASGINGGTIRIGGDYQGNGSVPNASQTFVDPTTILRADSLPSLTATSGGRIIVWSNQSTQFYGTALARGASSSSAPSTAKGGLIEISGKETLTFQGNVDVSAPGGQAGTVLFDPQDITIVAGTADPGLNVNFALPNAGILFGQGGTATNFQIGASTLAAITGNITLQASRDINLTTSLNLPGTQGSTLTFTAGRNFNGAGQTIAAPGRNITISAGTVTLGTLDTSLIAGVFSVPRPNAGNVSVTASSGDLNLTQINASVRSYYGFIGNGGTVTLQAANGSVNVSNAIDSSATAVGIYDIAGNGGSVNISAAPTGTIQVNTINTSALAFAASTTVGNGGAVTVTGGTIQLATLQTFSQANSADAANGGAIALNASNTIAITGAIDSSSQRTGSSGLVGNGGAVNLNAVTGITLNSVNSRSQINGGSGNAGNGGAIILSSSNGDITTASLNTSSRSQAGTAGNGGALTVTTGTGTITLGAIDSSSNGVNGGNVTLDPTGDIQVVSIDARGGAAGIGGSIDITTSRFFRATGVIPGSTESLSTVGGRDGGSITIRHGGGLLDTPFTVGNARINGTAGKILTSQDNTILSGRSFLGRYSQGSGSDQIQLITATRSTSESGTSSSSKQPLNPKDNQPRPPQLDPPEIPRSPTDSKPSNPEEKSTNAFTKHLELPYVPKILGNSEARDTLRRIESVTGIKPSLLYVQFAAGDLVQADSDPLELILVTATGTPIRRQIPGTTRARVLETARRFRYEASDPRKTRTRSYLAAAQQLYQWIIAPIEADLQAQKIQNLAFILDTGLRFIPLAALHNGQEFLVERYSLGLMPSLSLTDTRYTDVRQYQVLAAGASMFTEQVPLPAVLVELTAIARDRWQSQSLFNHEFTLSNLKTERKRTPFGIIHLATHGEFLPGALKNSYIQLWDTRLSLDRLRQMDWSTPPVELVVLSACQMALGNDDAELGFAGFAVQAGAKSALASLWTVSDEGTAGLMAEFYHQLQTASIKAEALRQTQIAMLKGQVRVQNGKLLWSNGELPLPPELSQRGNQALSHPYYWASFTLIGSPW